MPTALRIGPYRFYSYDCQEPRHMHVDRDRYTCKLWLDPTVIIALTFDSAEGVSGFFYGIPIRNRTSGRLP